MTALLNSKGYYEPLIEWDSTLKRMNNQERVNVNFTVHTGKQLKLDSIAFDLTDTALQRLTMRSINKSLLKKGAPYTKQIVALEIDRLVDLFKNHGYYFFSRENLYAEVDTVVAALINPGLDPFEQLALLEELQRKKEHPTIDVVIRQQVKQNRGLKKYYIGNVSIYPELKMLDDTAHIDFDTISSKGMLVYTKEDKFKPAFLARNILLKPGKLYRQDNYIKTVNNFYQLGAWRNVSVDIVPDDSAGTLNIIVLLYPAKKQTLTIDLEASRNTGDVIASSNLLGFGLNVGLRNINVAREAIETNTNAREGIELGTRSQLIQTFQTSFTHNIYIPKFVLPFKVNDTRLSASRTVLNFNASYTDRRDFFTLGSINGSIGYEWTRRNHSWFYSPLNIELVRLGTTDSLNKLFTSIPNLRFSFNNGLVVSQFLVYKTYQNRKNKSNSLKIGLEESGALAGLFKYIDTESGLYRYIKMDIDYRHLIRFDKSAWGFRAYGGLGIPYGRQRNGTIEPSLPFFKSFVAGGPNSMRGWQVRRLGLGSSNYFDTLNSGGFDRFGDIQLEGNVEYRFNLFTIKSMKVKSALFADIGNIWYRSNPSNNPALENAAFKFSRLYKDLAVDGGTGLRFDFEYFLIRFDWAYKLKNPVYADIDDGWFHNVTLGSGQFQLGINYPF
jgi:outer membrane protein assembly factor BamA